MGFFFSPLLPFLFLHLLSFISGVICRIPIVFPWGFRRSLGRAPWSTGPRRRAGMERGLLSSEVEEKSRGTIRRKPSSTPPKRNLAEGGFGPRSVVNLSLASQLKLSSKPSGGKYCLFLLFPCTRGRRKRTKQKKNNCSGFFFFLFPTFFFFYPNTFKVNFKKLGTLDSFN